MTHQTVRYGYDGIGLWKRTKGLWKRILANHQYVVVYVLFLVLF